jgi:hypothetical protein
VVRGYLYIDILSKVLMQAGVAGMDRRLVLPLIGN